MMPTVLRILRRQRSVAHSSSAALYCCPRVNSSLRRSTMASSAPHAADASDAYITLPSGSKMPYIGLGLWKADKSTLPDVVEQAVRIGYRHFDSASDYGNERQTGDGLQRAMKQGLVRRDELFITTKLWNTYHARAHVRPALERCLADLQLEYVDLFLIHFPISLEYVDFKERYPAGWSASGETKDAKLSSTGDSIRETWEAMEELLSTGLVKNIGVSNFNSALLGDLLRYCKVKPACNQLELHPLLPSAGLVRYCQYNNIAAVAFSPFGQQSYVGLNMGAESRPALLSHPVITAVAQRHHRTPAQVLLRWSVQRGVPAIPKSVNEKRLKENLAVFDFKLSETDVRQIDELNGGVPHRFNDPGQFAGVQCAIWD